MTSHKNTSALTKRLAIAYMRCLRNGDENRTHNPYEMNEKRKANQHILHSFVVANAIHHIIALQDRKQNDE